MIMKPDTRLSHSARETDIFVVYFTLYLWLIISANNINIFVLSTKYKEHKKTKMLFKWTWRVINYR